MINKIIKIYFRKKAFKSIGQYLQNGCYYLDGESFSLLNDKNVIHTVKKYLRNNIYSRKKVKKVYSYGLFKETDYKYIFIFDDIVIYIYRKKHLFLTLKEKYILYKSKLIYKTIDLDFYEKIKMVKAEKVDGTIFNDEQHLVLFIDYYLNKIGKLIITKKTISVSQKNVTVYYAPQHGDIHKGNVLWNEDSFCLIDLDDMDEYPLFYDLFYYCLSFKHELAFIMFQDECFKSSLINCYKTISKEELQIIDIVDTYLSLYVSFWVDKINKATNPFEPYFYLRWFINANLEAFPLTKKSVNFYHYKAKMFNKVYKAK